MGYEKLSEDIRDIRKGRIKALRGEERPKWFTDQFSSISDMLDACDSSAENGAIASGYKDMTYPTKIKNGMKLDYVCALRKDIRRQFASLEADPFTDVTPYRLSAESVNGGGLFDELMKEVINKIKD